MAIQFHNVEQGTDKWHELRRDRITASRFGKVMTGGEKAWLSLIDEIKNGSSFTGNAATRWGNQHEDEAIALFEMLNGIDVERVGFATNDKYEYIGVSPDGLIGDVSGCEVKCPYNPENHTATRLSQQIPNIYVPQVQGTMMVLERDHWWFLSYDPREIPENRLVKLRIERDDSYIEKLSARCQDFLLCLHGKKSVAEMFGKITEGGIPDFF